MALPSITLSLEELMAGEENIPQQIISEAAASLLNSCRKTAEDEVQRIVESEFRGTIAASINAKVEEAFNAQLTETDSYGSPRRNGRTLTLNEVLVETIQRMLLDKVDSSGRPDYHGTPRLQQVAQAIVREAIEKDLKPQIAAAKDEVTKALKSRLAGIFAESVTKALGAA